MKKTLTIPGPAGQLEAVLEIPDATPRAIAVICHPHPEYGGTMNNKVVTAVSRALSELNVINLRFNYRGVGNSEGEYAAMKGETEDAHAAIKFIKNEYPDLPLWLAGFSFGTGIVTHIAHDNPPEQLVLIAPPVKRYELKKYTWDCPTVIALGGKDDVVDVDVIKNWQKTLTPAPTFIFFEGAGHFFHGYLIELREALVSALET